MKKCKDSDSPDHAGEKNDTKTGKNTTNSDNWGAEPVSMEKGRVILKLYTVESSAIVGGMGCVYRVHHPGWNVDLALKQPQPELFQKPEDKTFFNDECEHWIKLGLHPNVVACYYVRDVNGVPSIFSEWMDKGSLREYIKSEALYNDSEKEVLERILDISIQFARGLYYAHEQGLIHQDVKPANLLLTIDGRAKVLTAKVCDFGIAGARENMTNINDGNGSSGDKTIVVKGHAYTPAYCSPEQKKGIALTRRTDIWSWAVSILEMFLGERQWAEDGAEAGSRCEDLFMKKMRISMPKSMKDLLRHCFKENEAERPHDFGVVEEKLLKIYQTETGTTYPRPKPKAAPNSADSLNNRALSFLDLKKPEEAEKCWKQAFVITPNHVESLYNQSIHLWQKGQIDDLTVLSRLSNNRTEMADYYLAKIHLSRCDAEGAVECLKKAKKTLGEIVDIDKAMATALRMIKTRESIKCTHTFNIPRKYVYSVCYSPDGKTILSVIGSVIKLWDIATKQCIRTFDVHESYVYSACFSPDGKIILSYWHKNFMKLWDVATGECLRTINTDKNIRSMCLSLDRKTALSCNYNKTMTLWEMATGRSLHIINTDKIDSVCLSPDEKTALSIGEYGNMNLWDIDTEQCIREFKKQSSFQRFTSFCFSPDGKAVLSGMSDNTINLYDITTGQCIRTFEGHVQEITSVCFNPNGKIVLSCSKDKTFKFWDVATGYCIRTFEGHSHEICSACFSQDGKTAISCGFSEIKLWSISGKPYFEMAQSRIVPTETVLSNKELIDSLVAEANTSLFKGNVQNTLSVLTKLTKNAHFKNSSAYFALKKQIGHYCVLSNINYVVQVKSLTHDAKTICFSPDGKTFLSAGKSYNFYSDDYTLMLWELTTGQCLHSFGGYKHDILSVCFSPDGRTILSSSRIDYIPYWISHNSLGTVMKLWDAETGKCIRSFEEQSHIIYSVCFSPDGMTAISGGNDNNVKLWDVTTGECLRTFEGHKEEVKAVYFSLDGKTVISCSSYNTRLWSVMTGMCINSYRIAAYFSPDRKTMLSGLGDAIVLRDVATGQRIRTFEGDTVHSHPICFSPDGKIALSCKREYINLWDVATGKCIHTIGNKHLIKSACFSPDGKIVLLCDLNMTLSVWHIATLQCIHSSLRLTDCFSAYFSLDGTQIIAIGRRKIHIYNIDYDIHFPGYTDWDDGALPYIKNFLSLYPNYTDTDFERLITELQNCGYGWLLPKGVKAKLQKLSSGKTEFFSWIKQKLLMFRH